MANIKKLHEAKQNKNDEFYTDKKTIENELKWYEKHFKNKVILMNCDDPILNQNFELSDEFQKFIAKGIENKNPNTIKNALEFYRKENKFFYEENASQFWVYFHKSFKRLGLKRIIASHYDKNNQTSYYVEYDGTGSDFDIFNLNIHFFKESNGDFRDSECIELLKQSDIVVTNPPFSLFREYVKTLLDNHKKIIILGHQNAISYKEIFPYIKEQKLWLGTGSNKTFEFKVPQDYELKTSNSRIDTNGTKYISVSGITWWTNLEHEKRKELYNLTYTYNGNESYYPKYENYDAINVDKAKEIPKDYDSEMGVPISFLNKLNPNQFEIKGLGRNPHVPTIPNKDGKKEDVYYMSNGKIIWPYMRLIIKKKKIQKEGK